MCGILGILGNNIQTSKEKFTQALDTLKQRGPDDSGLFFDNHCYFGHRRLSIIDLKNGQQPMTSNDGRYTIIFNGEIYNFKTLKEKLSDYNFKTNSDTEVILAAFKKYGKKIVDILEGMFAMAIYDQEKKTLFLARDPIGMKPLVYTEYQGHFYFASELKALMPLLNKKNKISEQAVFDFFCLKHIPAPNTIYKDIFKLPAGHYLEVSLKDKEIKVGEPCAYWRPIYEDNDRGLNIKEVREKIIETVESHLVSDVPVGVFLSGGIDSTAIVWAMSELGCDLSTYTIGFSDLKNDNDLIYSRLVAKKFGTKHSELLVDTHDYNNVARCVSKYFDEPFADPAFISNYYVSRETAGHVKVALSGDGGDELFFGYPVYTRINKIRKIKKLFGLSDKNWVLEKYFGYNLDLIRKMAQGSSASVSIFPDRRFKDGRVLMRMFDLESTLPEYYLNKTDKTSMMSSLEVRTPFTHRPLVDYILSIPVKHHYKFGKGKNILKQVLAGYIPEEILNRSKQGFSRPVHLLLHESNLSFIEVTIKDLNLFNTEGVGSIISSYRRQKQNQSLVWCLLVFCWWFEDNNQYLDI